MRYEKPEIEIEKISILDEILDGGTSGNIPIIDEDNDDNIILESIGEALGNIFGE